MNRLLIICGPTATGKTSFGLEVAGKFNGEIISADSRQVYSGMDIVTGKDIPPGSKPVVTELRWRDRLLKYYEISGIKVWLYDIVKPDEPFNLAFWKECADLVLADIYSRGKLPVIVGGTGLYIKSLTSDLEKISVPPNQLLRNKLENKSPLYLFNYLNKINASISASMNISDRQNPRRLMRAIEVALNPRPTPDSLHTSHHPKLLIALTAPREDLYRRVDTRVEERMEMGAAEETEILVKKYGWDLPSMSAAGYTVLKNGEDSASRWKFLEHSYVRRQLTWFKKQPGVTWFDISLPVWRKNALSIIQNWYNKKRA